VTVENNKGENEVLTDYQSYAAGYRTAVLDLTTEEGEKTTNFSPYFYFFLGYLIALFLLRFTLREK
jgi:hypothetical protein